MSVGLEIGRRRDPPNCLNPLNASPIDLLGAAAILDILKALAVNQHGISELAFCEASLFEALSIKNCKMTMGKKSFILLLLF